MRIGFLFNHYTAHQVYHSAPIAFALSLKNPNADVAIIAARKNLLETAMAIGDRYPGHKVRFQLLKLPFFQHLLEKIFNRVIRKEPVLKSNIELFKTFDALVLPEKNSLFLKKFSELSHLKYVRIRHGAGDRETGLDGSNKEFDLILASGRKMKDRLGRTVPSERCVVIGYPKFDVAAKAILTEKLFKSDNPVVLYNPHFREDESSWPTMGLQVLEFFKKNRQYNLIFAPHILLFKRRLKSSGILKPFRSLPNIHIDTGSSASLDMTYTLQADIYLGDVSSQIYEFLLRPRPCIFLNAHHVRWQNDINYAHWQTGQVLDDTSQLPDALQKAQSVQHDFIGKQKELFDYTFDINETPSALRAAMAIEEKIILN